MARIFRHYIAHELILLVACDAVFLLLSVVVASRLYSLDPAAPHTPISTSAALATIVALITAHTTGLYDRSRVYGRRELLLRVFLAFVAAYLVIAVIGYLAPPLRFARRLYAGSFVLGLTSVMGLRLAGQRLGRASLPRRRMLMVGSGEPARIIAEAVRSVSARYEIVGCVDGQAARVGRHVDGMKVLGTVNDLSGVVHAARADVIVVALTERRQSLPIPAILDCKCQGVEVEDWPTLYEKLTGKIFVQDLRPSWLIFSDGFKTSRLTLALKRAFDLALSVVGLLLSLPFFPVLALLIKIDSRGPIIYRQERLGQGGKPFRLFKFRSMRHDAEAETGPTWASENDSRVTRVGRVLRRSRLDELPQLFNVLRGDMSLVGPRPERPLLVAELQEKIPFYMNRLAVKPGITGWAQVRYHYGSTIADAVEKLQYDLYYIKNLSLFLDLLIVLHTVQVVLFGRGAR